MTESQYQTLLRVVAAAIIRRRKEKEVKKDGKGKSSTNRSNIYE